LEFESIFLAEILFKLFNSFSVIFHVSDLCSGRWITSCAEQSLLPKPPFLWDTELGGTWDETIPELRGGSKTVCTPTCPGASG